MICVGVIKEKRFPFISAQQPFPNSTNSNEVVGDGDGSSDGVPEGMPDGTIDGKVDGKVVVVCPTTQGTC